MCLRLQNRSKWNRRAGPLSNTHHGEKTVQNTVLLSYQNTVNQAPTERSLAESNQQNGRISWLSVTEIEAFIKEKCTSFPTSFSKSVFSPSAISSSDRSAKCDGTRPRGGVFYEPNAQQSDEKRIMITGEEFVDLERFFYADNSDERTTATSQQAAAVLAEPIAINNKKGVSAIAADDFDLYNNNSTTNPFISLSNLKSNNGGNDDYVADNSPIRSNYTSACTSPTNVVSMPGSPYNDYFLLSGEEIMPERIAGGNFFESLDTFIKDEEDRLPPVYTPDNSNGALSSFAEFPDNIKYNNVNNNNNNVVINDNVDTRSQHHPALTLNLRDTFFMNDEISTPNIIDSIIEASEHPVQFIRDKEEIFNKSPFFTNTSLQELTPCPSASPPPISDTMDSFLTTLTSSPPPTVEVARKRGRPRKKRLISDEIPEDDEDGDETYTPSSSHHPRRKPRVSRAVAKKRVIYEDISEDEDYKPPHKILLAESSSPSSCSNEEVERRLAGVYDDSTDLIRVGKRGRPPKHARSISSDDYSLLDPEEAKYREMRDRNNEASRKSRFKRKLKEVHVSEECEELEMENIKLKAQVDELQKTVERYRDNLMKVMLSKK